ncbi:MAG: hypothetical protein JNM39_02135 [Bdellovibrionaceae bacterium]|nr:hypothetical protein [Pseudobdellovibrionaceae bacterium]
MDHWLIFFAEAHAPKTRVYQAETFDTEAHSFQKLMSLSVPEGTTQAGESMFFELNRLKARGLS